MEVDRWLEVRLWLARWLLKYARSHPQQKRVRVATVIEKGKVDDYILKACVNDLGIKRSNFKKLPHLILDEDELLAIIEKPPARSKDLKLEIQPPRVPVQDAYASGYLRLNVAMSRLFLDREDGKFITVKSLAAYFECPEKVAEISAATVGSEVWHSFGSGIKRRVIKINHRGARKWRKRAKRFVREIRFTR